MAQERMAGSFFLPYRKLRQEFLRKGVELNTADLNAGRKVAFELYINCCRQSPKARAYVYLYENPLIRLINRDRRLLARYAKWFTWDGELLDDQRAVRLFLPESDTSFGLRRSAGTSIVPSSCHYEQRNKKL